MVFEQKENDSQILKDIIVRGIQEKKGNDIVSIDLREVHNTLCDFFVICHGDSERQVDAIAKSVEEFTRKDLKEKPWQVEGVKNAQWILLDYVSVVVHVFHRDMRDFYDLEKLWGDAKFERVDDVA